MITKDKLPAAYKPFSHLRLCGNEIVGGGNILTIGDVVPLLIGTGEKPLVWLQAPTSKTRKFVTVIEASIPRYAAFNVLSEDDTLTVRYSHSVIARIRTLSADSAEVDLLDLRPIGIQLHGDSRQLQAGGMTFGSNTFQNVGTLIAFGVEGKA